MQGGTLDSGGRTESIALSPGERVSRSGASTSRSGTGEGFLAQFREPTSSVAPRSSIAVQSNSTPQAGIAGETGGEPSPSASGRATRTMSRFELRFGCAARGGPQGQRKTVADAKLWPASWFVNGRNPSPVRRRLERAPSPDTLSPRERAIFPTWAPPASSRRYG